MIKLLLEVLFSNIFDGLVTAPVAYVLHEKGIPSHILYKKEVTLTELTKHFKVNEGYLNVGLRVLCSQEFFDYHTEHIADQIKFSIRF